jgi:hypothetical protein
VKGETRLGSVFFVLRPRETQQATNSRKGRPLKVSTHSKPKALLAQLMRDNPGADEASLKTLFDELVRKDRNLQIGIIEDVFDDLGVDGVLSLLSKNKH